MRCGGDGAEGGVESLEGADGDVVADEGLDALDGCSGALHGGDAGDVPGYRGGADLVTVHAGSRIAVGSVDDHVDLPGGDQIDDVVRTFEVLAHDSARNPVSAQRVRGSTGGEDFKAQVGQPFGGEHHGPLVPVGHRHEHS